MNHANRRLVLGSGILALSVAAFAGCATGAKDRLALRFDAVAEKGDRVPAKEGNGGPRGGGDRVAGEFMEYERIALAKMEAWHKQGKIGVTDEELAKIRALMPPNEPENPRHIVASEDHTCLDDRKTKEGQCASPVQERDFVKEPFGKPPTISVGRVRWDEPGNTPAKKEADAQHELRGLALSKPGQPFADEAFDQTYRALAAAQKEWAEVVWKHLDYLRKIRMYDETYELIDLAHFESVIHTVMSSSDYDRCVNASDEEVAEIGKVEAKLAKKIGRKAKRDGVFANLRRIERARSELNGTDAKRACDRAIEQMAKGLQYEAQRPSVTRARGEAEARAAGRTYVPEPWLADAKEDVAPMQRQANEINKKVKDTFYEWQTWANTVQNPAWHAWLFRTTQGYIAERNLAFAEFNHVSSVSMEATLNAAMDKVCPRSANRDFRDAARCNITQGVKVANAFFRATLGKVVDGLLSAHDRVVDEVASRVDPI